jgi:hypothetical protein
MTAAMLVPRLRPFAPPSGLPAISPTRGEIRLLQEFPQSPTPNDEATRAKPPISPRVGEMAGRPEGGATGRERAGRGFAP